MGFRGFMVEWEQEDVGRRKFPGFPIHFADPAEIPMRGTPALGADNRYVLVDVLGYAEERVGALAEAGVIATAPPES
jgi:crotonobetainyl-CoA:carnitine CoA-transferase CaiB-like acyl-CoA transferase